MGLAGKLTAVVVLFWSMAAAAPSVVAGPGTPVSRTFEFTGAAEDFVVPAGVCRVGIVATGAQGGRGDAAGGGGGAATVTLAVTPGEILVVRVGGAGSPGVRSDQDGGGRAGIGGFNGCFFGC